MTELMRVFDSLDEYHQAVVRIMSEVAREALRDAGIRPRNDDAAAVFDEACARFLVQSRDGEL